MNDGRSRVIRSFVQLVAGGGLTALVGALVQSGLDPAQTTTVMAICTFLVTFCQNYAEDAGWVRPLLRDVSGKEVS